MNEKLPQVRCPYCDKRLFDGVVYAVEIICPRCKRMVNVQVLNLKARIQEIKLKRYGGNNHARHSK